MKEKDILHGFEVLRKRQSQELGGTLWEMRHVKTGAQLVWLDNGESNKVFSVAFKTLPWDHTGVFHILEHSVLCGSQNFPVKEPFLDMLKSSMNTFLNAMTFADKTVYPVSSRNEQDFLNLTRVYLDAVFCPAIYTNPSIFHQEGWHYELTEGQEQPIYKGVVFNEMKGAMSSVDDQLNCGICAMLFPDNCYRFVSGGDPRHIPELTYEDFLGGHRRFYNPTNAKIYLDGAVPLDRVLTMIDEEYLSKFDYTQCDYQIPLQQPIAAAEQVSYYEIGKEEAQENKTQMVLGKVLGHWSDRKQSMALSILSDYLAGTNEAPLKRAVLATGLAQDMSIYIDDSVLQPYGVLHVRNTELEHKEVLLSTIRDTVTQQVEQGLEAEELEAIVSQYAFALKEAREPKGIMRNIMTLTGWLHEGDPMLYLESDEILQQLRQAIGTGYYEQLLRQWLLEEKGLAQLYLLPSKTKGDELRAEEEAKLAAASAAWTDAQRQEVQQLNEKLQMWQCSVDSPEAVATLPVLSLRDVGEEPEWVSTQQMEAEGVCAIYHNVATNGTVHCNLIFPLNDLDSASLQKLSFVTSLLGELPAGPYSAQKLQRLIKQKIGRMHFSMPVIPVDGDPAACKASFMVSFSALKELAQEAAALVRTILCETDFSDSGKIKELLLQSVENTRQSLMMRGNSYASRRAGASCSADHALQEQLSGLDMLRWMESFSGDFDGQIGAFTQFASGVGQKIFRTRRPLLSQTAPAFIPEIAEVFGDLCCQQLQIPECMRPALRERNAKEAILIPAGVSYAAMSGHLSRYAKTFDGSLPVLSTILSFGYLWNEIRVRGGAYGCGFRAGEAGGLSFTSYRDPSPIRSLDIYRNTPAFIREFVEGDEQLEKYIISTVSSMEPLTSPDRAGINADTDYLRGVTKEKRAAIRKQMLALTKEDILQLAALFEAMAEDNAACVIGNEAALKDLDDSWNIVSL